MNRCGKPSLLLLKGIGRRFTLFFDAADILPADAQDFVQGFFAYLLEHDTLSRADREKGRLRIFLLASRRIFILDEHGRVHALKRGGGRQIVSLDREVAEAEAAMLASAELNG